MWRDPYGSGRSSAESAGCFEEEGPHGQGDPQLNRQENDDARASPEGTHMAQGDVQLNKSKESVEEAAVLGVCRPSSLASGV